MNDALVIDKHCFICGKENPFGLKLDIQRLENPIRSTASFTLEKPYQGYGGVIHGGILASILDELMIYALYFWEIPTVTAKMEVKFKKKVSVGEPLTGFAWMKKDRGKMIEAEAEIVNSNGEQVSLGIGLFVKVDAVTRL